MNLVSVCWCLFIPWISFCLIYATCSFNMHYSRPWMTWGVIAVFSLVTLIFGACGAISLRRRGWNDVSAEPTWFCFLFLSMLIAVVAAVVLGNENFYTFMQKYYDYLNLNEYNHVNVATTKGAQIMDAARVNFINSTVLDLRKSIGFKNLQTYCVAPITVTNSNDMRTELGNYDFWAVGIDCCGGHLTDFTCGDYNNPAAHSGLRLLADDERSFYRLAVQQAEAVYHLRANHPLFFYWTKDPKQELESWRQEGYKFFFLAMFAHFLFQLLAVALGAWGFAQMGKI